MDFIPVAEETGLILPIGDWGLSEACRQIQDWCREDPEEAAPRVCVNLSARQFAREGLADHVEALLRQIGSVEPAARTGDDGVERDLRYRNRSGGAVQPAETWGLVAHGRFWHRLQLAEPSAFFPFDVLKIDRSFVIRMTEGEQPFQIVRTIVELARVLGMDVVAEGIETHEQYNLLRQLGCRFGQGYLFSRPVPAGFDQRDAATAGTDFAGTRQRWIGRELDHPPELVRGLAKVGHL